MSAALSFTRRFIRKARDDQEILAKRLERLQDAREHEIFSSLGGRPLIHDDAVRNVHDAEAKRGPCRRVGGRSQGRHHAVEQRQARLVLSLFLIVRTFADRTARMRFDSI